jgi:hypothetical protein
MAVNPEFGYGSEIEESMRRLYGSLDEKDRRRYAAVEAEKLGHGGVTYIAGVFGCSRHTIERGERELKQLPDDDAEGRVRQPGGGRKPLEESDPNLMENLKQLLHTRTAGDPMEPDVRWTDLSAADISRKLSDMGTPACPDTVRRLLHQLKIGRRKIEKSMECGQPSVRNSQFELIYTLEELYSAEDQPVFSMDTKHKEQLGQLFRAGRVWTQEPQQAFDHDFPSLAEGVIIPHGIYDLRENHGQINIGLSHDTSEFAADSFLTFWNDWGRAHYPHAREILLECDAGGSNSYRVRGFKVAVQRIADTIRIPVSVAHYPSYCSKFNPIDRRFFAHVSRACEGVLFDSLESVVDLIRRTSTRTGLTTGVNIIRKAYETGREFASDIMDALDLERSSLNPQLNYTLTPR